jgi:cytochrome c peroxidase
MSAGAQRGLALYAGKARCVSCHTGFNVTDEGYHNIGAGMDKENPDLGRFVVTKNEADKGAFKTPTLRDAARRGPYMHDGSLKTLEEVVAFYNRGGHRNPSLSKEVQPLNLTADEQADLAAFLRALTGEVAPEVASAPRLPQ